VTTTSGSSDRTEVTVEGRNLTLSNLDKVLWPEHGLTKQWLLSYYAQVAGTLLPHLAGRPLTLHRFPDGVDGTHWYQTRAPAHPPWVQTVTLHYPRTGKTFDVCVVADAAALLWAVNLGTIEFHPFLARGDAFDRPTALVFDLDPGWPATIVECAVVALRLRELLDDLGLPTLVKTSGAKGLHVYVPLDGSHVYDETKAFGHVLVRVLRREIPELVVDRMARSARTGKVFVDWTQNDAGKSTVAPYSLRAGDVPTVSTPVHWDEVERCHAREQPGLLVFTSDDVLARISEMGDLFAAASQPGVRLPMPVQPSS
jgi:bifunctional non-homologous end joining protein LigD